MAELISRILVATDFSACSLVAMRYAQALAGTLGASVDVLHVWDYRLVYGAAMSSSGPAERTVEIMEAQARQRLRDFCAQAAAAGAPIGKQLLRAGSAAELVCDTASDYQLLIVGTHGRTGVPRLFLGSVAEQIVRAAPCPVLTIRDPD